jgi:hypothetical protein
MSLTSWLVVGAAVLGFVGLVMLLKGSKRGAALLRRFVGLVLIAIACVLFGAGITLRQYRWLLEDVPAATISLTQDGPQRFTAVLRVEGEEARTFELLGDEWQLDARVIRWTLPVALGGLPPMYAFERLSGRYGDPKQELSERRSVHDLRAEYDFWEFRQRWLADLPIVEARWGSAAYLPMLDGATYVVYVAPRGGLVAKPADEETEQLLDAAGW